MLTLKKVKEMVKAPVHTKRVPSPKVLLEDGRILLRKEFEHDSHLTLYHSGYVWFSTGKRNTVFHIHDCCGDYAYGASKGKGEVIKEEYFENCEWHIRALFEGEQRVEESQLKCEGVGQTKVCVSYHAVAEDWGEMADSEIKYGVMKFNMACIRLFEGIKYVLPILHPNKKRLALIMCPEEDSASVEWARQKGENWVNKDITSLEFVENIFRLMNWNRECRYKVLGRVANSDQGLCMLFDLEEAIMFTPKPQEYADPLTGEMKKKQMKFFPDTYRNRIGKSYNDYIADHQMNMFEDFIGYQGSAVLDEPVREEDSFSKESMSQESEISENILLPDLAKQSESIEQQSGEIAERGMPT